MKVYNNTISLELTDAQLKLLLSCMYTTRTKLTLDMCADTLIPSTEGYLKGQSKMNVCNSIIQLEKLLNEKQLELSSEGLR